MKNKTIYSLRISCQDGTQTNKVSKILNKVPNEQIGNMWILNIEEYENDAYFDFINYFLDILKNTYSSLELIGISKNNISVWLLYQYIDQCNLEFLPKDLKRLGDEDISLCVSCWT